MSRQTRTAESADLAAHLTSVVAPRSTIGAYVPVGSEPGSLAAIDTLAARGVVVLLPVARSGPDGAPLPLRWGRHRPGELVDAPFGLREPPGPWLPPDSVGEATIVLVPALAVDHRGTRLGRGAGFYDRSLALTAPGSLLVAVVRDDELVDQLPAEPHDVPMTHALTPARGLTLLGESSDPPGGSST